MALEVRTLRVDEIETSKYNPREELSPGDPRYERLARSLEEFGLVQPLVWNERTERLVGGHQRLEILRRRGEETVEVSVVDIDEEKERALNIALNNPNLSGDWDADKLQEIAEAMALEDLRLAGFESQQEVEEMLRRADLSGATSFLDEFLQGGIEQVPAVPPADEDETGDDREPTPTAEANGSGSKSGGDFDGRPREIDMKEEHKHRTGVQMFTETLILTVEQRAIYFQAIDRAKRHFGLENTYEAVTALMNEFNTRWEQGHIEAGVSGGD